MHRRSLYAVASVALGIAGLDSCAAQALSTAVTPIKAATQQQIAFHEFNQDLRVAGILQTLQASAPSGLVIFRNVQVVDPDGETVSPDQTVIVSGAPVNRIVWVGETAKAPSPPGATIIDGSGKYLSPGLVDMHIHSTSADGWLLNLANGVTAVREMDGFPWLLRVRDHVNAGRMLAPVLYVAGTIIAALPLGDGYAVVAANSADARRIVRQEAACGYDFIKVHNVLPEAMFDAVTEQAHQIGLDVVGHVPHEITLDHALHAGGMRTTEHLKGFLLDATQEVTDEDFAKALAGTETWITPTLYIRIAHDRSDAARAILDGPNAAFVPLRRRQEWAALLQAPPASTERLAEDKLFTTMRKSQDKIMRTLLPLNRRWLAGTDADGYPFNIMGFALIDELRLLQEAGLSPAGALRAATSEPARAMRQGTEFGRIAPRARADLVLLEHNPLESTSAYSSNQGVMAHGIWLDRRRLDSALTELAAIASEPDTAMVISKANATAMVELASSLTRDGFVFNSEELGSVAAAARESGFNGSAAQLESLAERPSGAPCALATPRQ